MRMMAFERGTASGGRNQRLLAALLAVGMVAVSCGGNSASPVPGAAGPNGGSPSGGTSTDGSAAPAGTWTPNPDATGNDPGVASPSPVGGPMPLVVITGFTNYKINGVSMAQLASHLKAGRVTVPCGTEPAVAAALGLPGTDGWAPCAEASAIPASIGNGSGKLALVPPGLVGPKVKVVPLGGVDLFGEEPSRKKAYPLTIEAPAGWKASWAAYDSADVRVVLFTGCTCPDRGVSHQTNVLGKGWDWLLQAGSAKYTGKHWNAAWEWWIVDAVRTGNEGALHRLLRDADITVSDFECNMTAHYAQHDAGTVFTVDPRVAPLMAKAGFDVATIATDHMTNAGTGALLETVGFLKKAGVAPVGAGANLAAALKPAVIDVGGVKFGFVGFDAIGGSAQAGPSSPGVATLTASNAQKAITQARRQGAQVVFALPQWSAVEYTADYTAAERSLASILIAAGADHVIGADHHWAGGISITPGGRSGHQYVASSQGNFWFGQDWSRQTMEGVMTELTFVGTRLVQARLIPTVVLDNAQVNLVNPATDGQYVLQQVFKASTLKMR
jgi:poly-gamma-glutamate capsule biosynthesis protein CapA/YwtB (metallophosphatase superfamily)